MRNVVIFGDSIIKGVLLKDGKYSVSQSVAWNEIEEALNVKIKNFARMGNTVPRSEKIIFDYVEKNFQEIDRVIIEYGGNDSDYDWQQVAASPSRDYRPKTEYEIFESSLSRIIDFIKSKNIDISLVTLPPISAEMYFNWITRKSSPLDIDNVMFFLGDVHIIYRRQEMYSGVIVKLAHKYGLDLVDVRFKFLSHDNFPSLLCEDGLHPNEKGGDLIVESFLEHFKNFNKK